MMLGSIARTRLRPSPSSLGRSFWTRALLIALGNCLIICAILLYGDRRVTTPVSVSPATGSRDVSTYSTIRVVYPRSIDAVSASSSFSIVPPVSGSVLVNGGEVTFQPDQLLRPDTLYTIDLPANLRETSGHQTGYDTRFSFTTRSSRLIVVQQNGATRSVWGVDPTSGRAWSISAPGNSVSALAPSPNGDELAYVTSDGADNWTMSAANVDTGSSRLVVPKTNGIVVSAAWSPQGDLIAFERSLVFGTQVSNPQIWLVKADGSTQSLVYGRGEETGSRPSWAPDGRKLAFYENHLGGFISFDFTRTLLRIPADVDAAAVWLPNAQSIVYANRTGNTGAQTRLNVAQLSGDQLSTQPITAGTAIDTRPAWSPNGSWIAFTRLAPNGLSGVWLVKPDGSEAQPIQQDRGWVYTGPVWAPDGTSLAFSRYPIGLSQSNHAPEIWLASISGATHVASTSGEVVAWVP